MFSMWLGILLFGGKCRHCASGVASRSFPIIFLSLPSATTEYRVIIPSACAYGVQSLTHFIVTMLRMTTDRNKLLVAMRPSVSLQPSEYIILFCTFFYTFVWHVYKQKKSSGYNAGFFSNKVLFQLWYLSTLIPSCRVFFILQ